MNNIILIILALGALALNTIGNIPIMIDIKKVTIIYLFYKTISEY